MAVFQKKKKVMEERTHGKPVSCRLFQQVPYQFCEAVCRVGFQRMYSVPCGRCRPLIFRASVGGDGWADLSKWLTTHSICCCGEGNHLQLAYSDKVIWEGSYFLSFICFVADGFNVDENVSSKIYSSLVFSVVMCFICREHFEAFCCCCYLHKIIITTTKPHPLIKRAFSWT